VDIPVLPPDAAAGERSDTLTTGRYIVVFKDGAAEPRRLRSVLENVAGLQAVASTSDFASGAVSPEAVAGADATHFEGLGVAVVSREDAMMALSASAADTDSPIMVVEPEYIAYPTAPVTLQQQYLLGIRDTVDLLLDQLSTPETITGEDAETLAGFADTDQFTWGLQATGVSSSKRSGKGIKVAVLDTGLDLQHPDFKNRAITAQSFVQGVTVQDVFGHGTHCIGTACGAQHPASGVRRYGIAFGAQIFVGKVFNNKQPRPSAATGDVVAGLEWAIQNGCQVVSLSLGVPLDQKIEQYETPIRRALAAGTLVVAAAGNNASRPANPGFVEPPANADSAMAVAAVDSGLQIARFSARSSKNTGTGGIVNIAAPGVRVFSSVPVSAGKHAFFDGTSMATPHVAGIAALWAEATGLRGSALWSRVLQAAHPLSLPSADAGSGLAQAPQ
jgi:subtilisin family serine protease